jgi:hypothetical protein
MAEENVKLRISAEADTGALDRTKAKINELRIEAEDLRKAAGKYAEKYGFEDSRAKSARSEATTREREANRLERPFLAEEKAEQKSARDEKARHLRSQRAEDRAAAADERAVKREMHQEETQRQRFGRIGMNLGMQAVQGGSLSGGIGSLAGMAGPGMMAGVAAIGAVAVGKLVEEISKDVHERRGIELRDQAARRMSKYEFGVMAGVRGTSGQAQSKEDDLTQQSEERAANRAELERKGERRWYNPLRWFGNKQTWESQRELTEDDKKQKKTQEDIETARALKREKFANEEGGLGLDALRQRSKRTQSGAREAFMDDYLAKARGVKRQMRGQGASEAEQNEAAQLDMTNSLRDRQVKAGASLVDARSGAGDIAAAARWGGQVTPNESEMVKRLDRIVTKMDETDRANRLKDHSVK